MLHLLRQPLTLARALTCLLGLLTLFLPLLGCDGSSAEAGQPVASPIAEYHLNQIVLGEPSPNVLKGMIIAADPLRSRVFVHGIKTENLALLDMATGNRLALIPVTGSVGGVRLAVDSRDGKVWVAKADGTRMWKVDPVTETVEIDRDLSDDGQGTFNWALEDILVMPSSGDVVTVRADGNRVVRYDDQGVKKGDLFVGQGIVDLDWAGATDELCLLKVSSFGGDSILLADPSTAVVRTTVDVSRSGEDPPSRAECLDDGTFLTMGSSLVHWDDQGTVLWATTVPPHSEAFTVSGSTVGVVVRYGATPGPTQQYGMLQRQRLGDGAIVGVDTVRFEPSRLAAIGGGDFAVGNGGDASVSFVRSGTVQTVKVGSSAAGVLFRQAGQRLLVLNRLGGSQLIDVDLATGGGSVRVAGDWPIGFAANTRDRRLFVLSHFESALHVLNLDTLQETGTIDLGLDGSMTDTLAALAADDDGTLLAASIGEYGAVVVVDGATEQILATRPLIGPLENAGPGRMRAAVDGTGRRIFVHVPSTGQLFRLEGSDFVVTGQGTVPLERGGGRGSVYPYALRTTFYDGEADRLFVGSKIVDPATLEVTGQLANVHRVVAARDGLLWAQYRDEATTEEWLVVLDAHSFAELSRSYLGSGVVGSVVAFDWPTGRMAFGRPSEAIVTLFELPSVQAEVPLVSGLGLCGLSLGLGLALPYRG